MILANSITLGLTDPCDIHCEKPLCTTLEIAEHTIFAFFFVEMLIKMLALGIYGPKSYLDEYWNCFDLFIVIVGIAEYLFVDADINLSAIRALRVLRPLRAINRISSLRLLVTLILDILPMIGNVMIFCLFLFVVFGIISVQLWAGVLRQRCFFPSQLSNNAMEAPPDFMPEFYKLANEDYVCSPVFGMRNCHQIPLFEKHNSMCAEMFGNDKEKLSVCKQWVGNYTECRADGENPGYGTTSFDNIGYASIAIFQVISLEGWVDVMYYVQDAFSFWVWIYFILLVLLGSYFAVKLCLVVIAAQFSVTRRREKERLKQQRIAEALSLGQPVDAISFSSAAADNGGLYEQILDLIAYLFERILQQICRIKPKTVTFLAKTTSEAITTTTGYGRCKKCENLMQAGHCQFCEQDHERQSTRKLEGKLRYIINTSRAWTRYAVDNDKSQGIVGFMIVINAIIMGTEHHGQPVELTNFIETSNKIFTAVFVVELLVRFYGFGPKAFVREAFNMLDTVVIIINVVEMFNSQQGASGLSVLRLFRLFRLVKILRFFPALQKQLLLMLHTVDNVTTFFLLLAFVMFVSALLGMSLFGCKFCTGKHEAKSEEQRDDIVKNNTWPFNASDRISLRGNCRYMILSIAENPLHIKDTEAKATATSKTENGHDECTEANFDSLFHSLFTVLQVFTRDDWARVMRDGMYYTSTWASVYFVFLVTIGDYVIFNLLIGILVEGFSKKQEEELEKHLIEQPRVVPSSKKKSEPKIKRTSLFDRFKKSLNEYGSDSSLFIFPTDSAFRRMMKQIVSSTCYDAVFIAFTLASCALIALERPNIEANERFFITVASFSISFAFLLEAAAKIVAHGFVLGRGAYLHSGWNILDFGLLILAVVDLAVELLHSNTVIHILRPIRLLRTLRPLRLISRARGLKVVLETLVISIKPIGHLVLICCFFFAVWAILGVQLFQGCYARCVPPKNHGNLVAANNSLSKQLPITPLSESELESLLETVQSRSHCLSLGLHWETESYNFNNFLSALMALFVFATLDGWADITRNGANCIGPDLMPAHEDNPWTYFYFISFLLIVCFFALNMFVGVVVNNFQKVIEKMAAEVAVAKKIVRTETLLYQLASKFLPNIAKGCLVRCARSRASNAESKEAFFWEEYPKWRFLLYKLMVNPAFEFAVMGAVAINVLSMAIESYKMPKQLDLAINITGYVFMALLTVEMASKMLAFGLFRYLEDRWNQLDLVVTLSSLTGLVLENIDTDFLPLNPSVVRIARVFRIVRVVKLWRAAKNLRRLLDTVSEAIPQVINLSILFVLLFFIYASLGVQLYGRFDCLFEKCEGLSRHANFHHFGMALLTLFRIFTGDNWNLIMKDVLQLSDPANCDVQEGESDISCSVISSVSPLYFVSFVLLAQFILINIVVAVLMQQIETIHKGTTIDENIVCIEEQIVTAQVANLEAEAIIRSQSSPEPFVPNIEGFDVSEVISIVSTDYVIRQEICDATYLSAKLQQLALRRAGRVEVDVAVENSPSSFFVPSPTISDGRTLSTMCDHHLMSNSVSTHTLAASPKNPPARVNKSVSTTVGCYDPVLWRKIACEVQMEFVRSPDKTKALTSYIEMRHRQLSRASSTVTWNFSDEQSSVIASPCISDKLFECASSQFDTWD